jgi:transcriptional regulator with XRE-family HTH domain
MSDNYKKTQLDTIVRNIKMYRERKKFNQLDLAEASGFSVGAIKSVESKQRFPRPETLAAIAKALDVTTFDLMRDQASEQEDIASKVYEKIKAVMQPQVVTVQIPSQSPAHLRGIIERLERLDPKKKKDAVFLRQMEQALDAFLAGGSVLHKKAK